MKTIRLYPDMGSQMQSLARILLDSEHTKSVAYCRASETEDVPPCDRGHYEITILEDEDYNVLYLVRRSVTTDDDAFIVLFSDDKDAAIQEYIVEAGEILSFVNEGSLEKWCETFYKAGFEDEVNEAREAMRERDDT